MTNNSTDDYVDGNPREHKCACAVNKDGSVTDMLCPRHADTDPCLTMARITGKRRKGTIKNGPCTNCGWSYPSTPNINPEAAYVAQHRPY